MLRGELLGAQTVGGDDLHGQRSGVDEAGRVQFNLGNHTVIRNLNE